MFNAEDVSEDLKIALRKRAEIDTKYLITFLQNDASELRQSLTRYVKNKTCTQICQLSLNTHP